MKTINSKKQVHSSQAPQTLKNPYIFMITIHHLQHHHSTIVHHNQTRIKPPSATMVNIQTNTSYIFPQTQSTVLPDPSKFFSSNLLSSPLPTNSFFQNFVIPNGTQPEYIHPYLIQSSNQKNQEHNITNCTQKKYEKKNT